jgi:hypothetical protein
LERCATVLLLNTFLKEAKNLYKFSAIADDDDRIALVELTFVNPLLSPTMMIG